MTAETTNQQDQVLGYTLTRKIGSGGYGDVWEAEAPGGLKKAIKIIHGYHDERRAQSELKALDRIKEVRHPFILSLERIEIQNSKLIVVSELAEKSLADLVNEFIAQGETGIPRDELLGYMRDTADALDHLNSTFGLQHLDIKPENILLVAGHAKVADFGLVKDLSEVSQSLMTGMTPAYAAPEMFDGRPGATSDQYSLAAVYQEMLTMVRPYSGSTPAQLAAQHMHGKPDLRMLPISDQPIVAKSSVKEPSDRYKSCRQFVEQLSSRKTRKRVIKSRAEVRERLDTATNTVVFGNKETKGGNESKGQTELFSDTRFLTFNSIDLESIDPPDCDPATTCFQPTLIVGLGNSSSQVLQKIKHRLVARHGDADQLPSLGLLCVDSDRDALAKLSVGRDLSMIKVSETLAVPLRRSEQYRNRAKLDLSWISRRWIYNVPRSMQTEGLRPLGRLAFVDHFESICSKISGCLTEILKPENISDTCEALSMNPPEEIKPRVIILTNISGGLGSGMVNDLAYTMRLLIAEQGLNNSQLIGMLMFGNEAVGRETGLATANAFAYLSELRHFADGGYPGDIRLGIPEFEDELPFDYLYGLRLSNEKRNSFDVNVGQDSGVLLFIHHNTLQCIFDASRVKENEHEEFGFRSFGVSVCGPGLQIQGRDSVERLSRNLIEQWISESRFEAGRDVEFAKSCFRRFKLSLDDTTTSLISYVNQLDEWDKAKTGIDQAAQTIFESNAIPKFSNIANYFDEILEAPKWRKDSASNNTELCLAAENEINIEAHGVGDKISLRILELLNENEISFPYVEACVESCLKLVAQEHESVVKGLHSYGNALQELRKLYADTIGGNQKPSFRRLMEIVNIYGKNRLEEFTLRCCSDHYRVIKSCLMSTRELIKKFRLQIKAVGDSFSVKEVEKRSAKYTPTIQQMLLDSVEENSSELILQIEKLVLQSIAAEDEKFLDILSDSTGWQNHLPTTITENAQSVLSNAFKMLSVDRVISENNIQPVAVKSWLNEQMNEATPFITDCGGAAMLLVGQPAKAGQSAISNIITECFDVNNKEISGTTGDLVLCFEAEQISLPNVAFSILKDAPEATEIAKRIESRNDVDWTSLDDLI